MPSQHRKTLLCNDQLHFVSEDFDVQALLDLRKGGEAFNPKLGEEKTTFEKLQFENFVNEVYLQSDTTLEHDVRAGRRALMWRTCHQPTSIVHPTSYLRNRCVPANVQI